MPQQVRGVVSHQRGDPVSIETIMIPDPGPDEAVVRVQACGVCHTDLHYREGGISDEFPFLLIELYLQGRLPLDTFVSETIGLDDVEAAFHDMERKQGPALGGAAVTRGPATW